jgi:hypothetical protein
MRRRRDHLFSVFRIAAVLFSLSGCAITVNIPSAGLGADPIPVREKLPVRAAIVITQAQRDAIHDIDAGADRLVLSGLAQRMEEALSASAAALFAAATVVRASPPPGTYDLVLAPRINGPTAEFPSIAKPQLRVAMSATLQVLDRSGKLLSVLPGEGRETLAHGPAMLWTEGERIAAATSRIVGKLVQDWTEQLATSRDLELYAKGGSAVQQVGSGSRPTPDIVISFSYPAEGSRLPEEHVTVVGLVSTSRGVGRLELAVNGRPVPVSRDVRVQPTDVKSHPFSAQVPLTPGQNLITLTVIDASGNAAQAVRVIFRDVPQATGTATAAKLGTGERWAVVIGIDQYKDPSISSLRYATADAESIFRFLTARGGVKPANARLLLNQQATQRVIREVLGGFLRQKATKDDEVIIYYAGHGTTEPDQSAEGGIAKYLVPWDADPTNLFASAIPMEEIDRVFGRLAARKILMIQDTCFSGGAGGRTFLAKGLAMRSATLTDRFLQDLSQREGRMILTASDVNQVSQEDPTLGHGIFTHYLLEALNGAADLDGDGAVTVREVHLYLQRKVHERSAGVQTPQLYNIGDMVMTRK